MNSGELDYYLMKGHVFCELCDEHDKYNVIPCDACGQKTCSEHFRKCKRCGHIGCFNVENGKGCMEICGDDCYCGPECMIAEGNELEHERQAEMSQ